MFIFLLTANIHSDIISSQDKRTNVHRPEGQESEVYDMKNTRTRTRVKSRPRFIAFLIIVIGLMAGSFGFITGMNETTASVTTNYTTYTVCAGDTLWDIANEVNYNNTDTRKIVHAICQVNDIQAGDLQPDMVLTIPTDM